MQIGKALAVLALFALGLGAQTRYSQTRSGPFWRHEVNYRFDRVGCKMFINGTQLTTSAFSTFIDSQSAAINFRSECSLAGGLASSVWVGTVTPDVPANTPIITREGFSETVPEGSFKTSARGIANFTPGLSRTPASLYDAKLTVVHGPTGTGQTCETKFDEKLRQSKGGISLATSAACSTKTVSLNSVSLPHGFGDSREYTEILTQVEYIASERWVGENTSITDGGGGAFWVKSQYKVALPRMELSPATVRISGPKFATATGSGAVTILNTGGGLLDWRFANPRDLLTLDVAGAGVVWAAGTPAKGDGLQTGQSATSVIALDTREVVAEGLFKGKMRILSDISTPPTTPGGVFEVAVEATIGTPAAPDSISLADLGPPPAQGLAGGTAARISCSVKYSLGSEDQAEIVFEALDATSGKAIASSGPLQVNKGSGTGGPFFLNFDVPKTSKKIQVRAVLRKGTRELKVTDWVEYAVGGEAVLTLVSSNPPEGAQVFFGNLSPVSAVIGFSLTGLPAGNLFLRVLDDAGNEIKSVGGGPIAAGAPLDTRQLILTDINIPKTAKTISLQAVIVDAATGNQTSKSDPVKYLVTGGQIQFELGTLPASGVFESLGPAPIVVEGGEEPKKLAFRVNADFPFEPMSLVLYQAPNPYNAYSSTFEISPEEDVEDTKRGLRSVLSGSFSGPRTGALFQLPILVRSTLGSYGVGLYMYLENRWGQRSDWYLQNISPNELVMATPLVQEDSIASNGNLLAGKSPLVRIPIRIARVTSNPVDVACELQSAEPDPAAKGWNAPPIYKTLLRQEVKSGIPQSGLAGTDSMETEMRLPELKDGAIRLFCTMSDRTGVLASAGVTYIVMSGPFVFPIGTNSNVLVGNVSFANAFSPDANPIYHVEIDKTLAGQTPQRNARGGKAGEQRQAAVKGGEFTGIPKTWNFYPPIPADGRFGAEMTVRYSKDLLPSEPGFKESEMKLVSIDPVTGLMESYPTTIDTQQGTATAKITGLAPTYSLGVIGVAVAPKIQATIVTGGAVTGTSVALLNAGTAELKAQVTADDSSGTAVDPLQTSIGPGRQIVSAVDAALGSLATGLRWLQARGDQAGLRGLSLISSTRGSDSLPMDGPGGTVLLVTGVENGSELHIQNASSVAASATIEYHGADGTLLGLISVILAPRQGFFERAGALFSRAPQPLKGYALIRATERISAAQVLASAGTLAALPAVDRESIGADAATYSAPLLTGGGAVTRLNIVNAGNRETAVSVRAFSENGSPLGQPDSVRLKPGAQYWRDAAEAFGLNPGALLIGSVVVDADGAIAGDVSIGDTLDRARGMVALTSGRANWVIPFVISGGGKETLVTVENRSEGAASVEIGVLRMDGSLAGTRTVPVPARGRISQPLTALIPSAAGQNGGHITIRANQLVTALALAGSLALDRDITVIAGQPGTGAGTVPPPPVPAIQVARSLDFGSATAGQSKDVKLTVTNGGTGVLIVSSVRSSVGAITVVSAPSFSVAAGQGVDVTLRFSPAAAGAITGTLTIVSNDTANSPVSVALIGTGVAATVGGPQIVVNPASLDFGTLSTGEADKDLTVAVRNSGSGTLTVSSANSSNTSFRLRLPALPFSVSAGGSQTVTIRFSPTAGGRQTGTLTLTANDSATPTVAVALSGSSGAVATAPSIDVTPAALDFGQVAVGQSKDSNIIVKNTGTAALTVAGLQIAGSGFSVPTGTGSFDVAAGTQRTIAVRFQAVSAGVQTALLTINSNDANRKSTVVSLRGEGTATVTRTVLQIDDGTFEQSLGFPNGAATAYFLNRITPASYPATLKAVQIPWIPESALSKTQAVKILAAPNPGGTANFSNVALASVPSTVLEFGRYIEYPVPDLTITSGDFLVGFMTANPAGTYPAAFDTNSTPKSRSYYSTDGLAFTLITNGNLGIRAVVETGGR